MRRLSISAVASRLGVSATALYRYVNGRWDLERLIGEGLLGELVLRDDPTEDTERHLVSFGLQVQAFTAQHPGLASYMQVLFPRGEAGARLMGEEIGALCRRGYSPDAAMVLSSAVAMLAISLAAQEDDAQAQRAGIADAERPEGFEAEVGAAADRLADDEQLEAAHEALPQITGTQFVRLLLTASIRGLVATIPPGRPIDEVVAELAAMGGDD
jgi:AcrR family transcriptional regulator